MVIFLYNQNIFVWIQQGCCAYIIFALYPSNSVIKRLNSVIRKLLKLLLSKLKLTENNNNVCLDTTL